MRVEMLAVGKELLIGRTVNTNAFWIGKRLARMGSMLAEVVVIDDDLGEIEAGIAGAVRRKADFLIIVGGLGPTPDDMTLKGVARALRVRLKQDGKALALIKEHYAKRGLGAVELTPSRLKMSRLPAGSEPLRNEAGTAPGVRISWRGVVMFSLPGVPLEMRSIFIRSVEPEIRGKLGKVHRSYVTMKLEGMLESALAPVIARELKRHPGAYIKSHPRGVKEGISRIELDVAVVGEDGKRTLEEGSAIVREMKRAVTGQGASVISVRGRRV